MNAINLRAIYSIFTRASIIFLLVSCTQEQQNKINRDIQNWTGTNGVLEVYAGDKLVRRFIKIDKLSTAMGTDDNKPSPIALATAYWTKTLICRRIPARKRSTSKSATTRPTMCFSKTPDNASPHR